MHKFVPQKFHILKLFEELHAATVNSDLIFTGKKIKLANNPQTYIEGGARVIRLEYHRDLNVGSFDWGYCKQPHKNTLEIQPTTHKSIMAASKHTFSSEKYKSNLILYHKRALQYKKIVLQYSKRVLQKAF